MKVSYYTIISKKLICKKKINKNLLSLGTNLLLNHLNNKFPNQLIFQNTSLAMNRKGKIKDSGFLSVTFSYI